MPFGHGFAFGLRAVFATGAACGEEVPENAGVVAAMVAGVALEAMEFGFVLFVEVFDGKAGVRDHLIFDTVAAIDSPLAFGEEKDEAAFDGGAGEFVLAVTGEEGFKLGVVFAGQDDVTTNGEAVGEVVLRDDGFAGVGFGASGMLRVGAVGG